MNRILLISIALLTLAWEPVAGEVSGRVTLASEYIFRGQAQSDRNPALQVGIDYDHKSGFFLGTWASTTDLVTPFGRRDVEVDYYIGWHFSGESRLAAALTLMRYTYPGQNTSFDYAYTEALATAIWDGRYSLEFGYTDDVYGFGVSASHVELRGDWPLRNTWVISAGLGVNDLGNIGSSRYVYGDLGISARVARFTFDLRWYDSGSPDGFPSRLSAGSRLVGAVSIGF